VIADGRLSLSGYPVFMRTAFTASRVGQSLWASRLTANITTLNRAPQQCYPLL